MKEILYLDSNYISMHSLHQINKLNLIVINFYKNNNRQDGMISLKKIKMQIWNIQKKTLNTSQLTLVETI
jgi:hypothetical protein